MQNPSNAKSIQCKIHPMQNPSNAKSPPDACFHRILRLQVASFTQVAAAKAKTKGQPA
jgi:hypothetical protein